MYYAELVVMMGEEKIRNRNNDVVPIVYAIWFFMENLTDTTYKTIFGININSLDNYVSYLVLILLVIYIFAFQKYSRIEICMIAIITILVGTSTVMSGKNFFISLLLFIVASKNLNFDRIIKISLQIGILMLSFTVISCWLGLIPDYTMYRGNILRHAWGYGHVNVLGMRVFNIVACIVYLYYEKRRNLTLFSIAMACVFIYLIPNSLTPFILSCSLLVLLFVYRIIEDNIRYQIYIQNLFIIVSILFNIFSVLLCVGDVLQSKLFSLMNSIVSSRFVLSHMAYLDYGISLFGQRVYISSEERQTVGLSGFYFLDNTYMILLVRFGAILYLIFSFVYIWTMVKSKKKNQFFITAILFIYSFYGVMEPAMYRFSHNTMLLLFGNVLYGNFQIGKEYKSKIKFIYGGNN